MLQENSKTSISKHLATNEAAPLHTCFDYFGKQFFGVDVESCGDTRHCLSMECSAIYSTLLAAL